MQIPALYMGGMGLEGGSLEPRLSIPDFVLQLWRKIDFSPKLRNKIWNGEPWFEASREEGGGEEGGGEEGGGEEGGV